MATTLAKAAGAEAVEHAARLEHVSKSFAAPGGQQLVLDDISSMSRRASSSRSWAPRGAASRRC